MRIANGDELGATGVLLKLACVSKPHRDRVVRWSRRKARATGETPAAVRAALARTAAFWDSGGLYDHDRDGPIVRSALEYAGYAGGQRAFVRACVALAVRPTSVAARMQTLKYAYGASPEDGFRVAAAVEAGAFAADFRILNFADESDQSDESDAEARSRAGSHQAWRARERKTRFAWNLAVVCEDLPLPASVVGNPRDPGLASIVDRAARDDGDGCAPLRLKLWIEECCGEAVRALERLALVKRTRPGTFARQHRGEFRDLATVHSRLRGR